MTGTPAPRLRRAAQAVVALAVVAAGFGVMSFLAALRRPPERRSLPPPRVEVRVQRLRARSLRALIEGHGTVRARYRLPVVPEVAGRVVEVSPHFRAGHRVAAGALLFRIDPRDYEVALERAEAEVARLEAQIRLVKKNQEYDAKRLATAEHARDLARKEFQRLRDLLRQQVGSEAEVEAAERTFWERERAVVELSLSLATQPIRLAELEAQLRSARAAVARARCDLERTRVVAPFAARVEAADLQVGQVVGPNGPAVGTLSKLGVLEIPVPLEHRELRWLPIVGVNERGEYLFDPRAEVTVEWVERDLRGRWHGRLDRLERFDPRTRTFQVVVVVEENPPRVPGPRGLQLEEGMFCRVAIRGKPVGEVIPVPRTLVRADGTVPLAVAGRLVYRPVEVRRYQGELALVGKGLRPGDLLVVSPLGRAASGVRLEVTGVEGGTP